MLNEKVVKLLNDQIPLELGAAYVYTDMANFYCQKGLNGFEHWFRIQARQEVDHAMLLNTYLLNNDESIQLLPVDAPKGGYTDLGDPLKKSLAQEKAVTGLIHAIYTAAADVKDYRTMEFLNWFIKEQQEEEIITGDLVKKFALYGSDAGALYTMDRELAARVYSDPPKLF